MSSLLEKLRRQPLNRQLSLSIWILFIGTGMLFGCGLYHYMEDIAEEEFSAEPSGRINYLPRFSYRTNSTNLLMKHRASSTPTISYWKSRPKIQTATALS
jgi:hypothetical protein